jgi:hypothetical protein
VDQNVKHWVWKRKQIIRHPCSILFYVLAGWLATLYGWVWLLMIPVHMVCVRLIIEEPEPHIIISLMAASLSLVSVGLCAVGYVLS